MEDFYRIRRLPPYVFEEVNRAKAAARNGGADIVDLGMGNPDLPAPAHVIDKLKETLGKPRTDRYSASRVEPQPGNPNCPHARLQGGFRQRRASDHRAGRRDCRSQSDLSDPRLRISHGGGWRT